MTSYQIGDVERLLDLKAHVLRYWEKEIALLQPRKDLAGRRVYSSKDVRILLRIKYLLYERHFTLQGAQEQLYRELAGNNQNARACLDALRSDLMELYTILRNMPKENQDGEPIS